MTVDIHPTACVEPGAELGDGVRIGPFCHVGPHVVLGRATQMRSHAVVTGYTQLGENCQLHPHAVIGGPPQIIGFQETDESRLEIGNNCILREFTTVHTGAPKSGGLTKIGNDCFMMVGAHIAHDNHIGEGVVMANNVALAGHITVGDHVWFGGQAAVHQFTRIGRNAFIGGGAILVEDVIPFGSVIGNHAKLSGLNIVGLKRRGFDKAQLQEVRAAYKAVFTGEGVFRDRLAAAAVTFRDKPLAMEMIDFIRAGGARAICKPG